MMRLNEDEIPEMDDNLPCFDVITNIQATVNQPPSPKGSVSTASTILSSADPFRQEFDTSDGNPRAAINPSKVPTVLPNA